MGLRNFFTSFYQAFKFSTLFGSPLILAALIYIFLYVLTSILYSHGNAPDTSGLMGIYFIMIALAIIGFVGLLLGIIIDFIRSYLPKK